MNITYISSYIPRKCGIATYTRDLSQQAEKDGNEISVVALENLVVPNVYSLPVSDVIRQNYSQDYLNIAKKINSGSTEIVHIQHEFGLFGGKDGIHLLTLAKTLIKPMIVTFHTVLLTPTKSQEFIIQELARLSSKIIVMDQIAKDRLESIYGLNASDISIILHGAPEIIEVSKSKAKKEIGYPNTFLMLANNLLSRSKGMEYAIEGVAKAIKSIPNLVFLIVGETHPVVKVNEGESYREGLIKLVKKLGIEKNVIFINKYVSLDELKNYLAAADVYITPYLDPEQTVSGTLSYALGAGKVCIATEYVYAKEMLANDKGMIVPFKNSNAIAKSLIDLFENPKKLRQIEANVSIFGKKMSWTNVSEKHKLVYKKTLLNKFNFQQRVLDFIQTPTNISHLIFLTNNTGIIQHSSERTPDLKFGYSTCDNARALIVVSQIFNKNHSEEIARLIKLYCQFLKNAQDKNGKFHTFLNSKKVWTDESGVTDAFGRVIWGLGYHSYSNKEHFSSSEISGLFQKSLDQIKNVTDIKAAAYTILGLYYYLLAFKDDPLKSQKALKHLEKLANFIKDAYDKNHSIGWEWFEDSVTYDNFRLPQALFAAYLITKKSSYKLIAETSLKFLHEHNFDKERNYFDFVGQDGWHKRSTPKADYDQQPLEAAGAVDANLFAAKVLGDEIYKERSVLAFEWFFGNNRNQRSIYDERSKGVADGLTNRGVSLNQGAESIICFLISLLSLQQANLAKEKSSFSSHGRFTTPTYISSVA